MARKRMMPLEWARKHANNLKKKKDELSEMGVYSSINKYLEECGSNDYSVGYWTILKHISLAYCINPFGKILRKKRIYDTVYLGLFCGAGITPLKSSEESKSEWIIGSPIISTRMTDYPFKKYYFGDKKKKSIQLVREILDEMDEKTGEKREYEIFHEDANIAFKKLLPKIQDKYVFAFIDPSGFQWNWESMGSLLNFKRFDIIMNFQTRQVDRIQEDKQKIFFGPCSRKINLHTNCDEKLNNYITQIKDLGLNVISIKIGMDRTQKYYYNLLHISRLDTYNNIVLDMKDRIERFNGELIKMVWNDLHRSTIQTSFQID